jgi:dihydroorotate dehydrogenase electron transfer subunit
MAVILSNEAVASDIFLMRAEGKFEGIAGQFYMLKTSETLDPFLKRPISIHDLTDDTISFRSRLTDRSETDLRFMIAIRF